MPPPATPQAQLVRAATGSAPATPTNAPISKTWAQIFPTQVESAEQSLKFVQKLLAVGGGCQPPPNIARLEGLEESDSKAKPRSNSMT